MKTLQKKQPYVFDVDLEQAVMGEIGIGFFKKLSRSIKKVGRAVGKVGVAIVKSPLVKAVAGGAAMVFPPLGAPVAAALVAADKVISMASSADKARAAVAKAILVNTKAEAKTDPNAARAMKALKMVYTRKKATAQMTPAQRAERARLAAKKERETRAALAAYKRMQGEPLHGGFLVNAQGRITKGKFRKAV